MPEIDEKVVAEKMKSGKELNREERLSVLKTDDYVPPGYSKTSVKPIPQDSAVEEVKIKEPEKLPIASVSEDPFLKLETELAKEEGKEDLTRFTEKEKAYFHQMKRDRKARQQAEADRDAALFRETKAKKNEPEKVVEPEHDPLEDFKKKDPTDFLTVAEVVSLFEKINKKQEVKKEEPKVESTRQPDPIFMSFLKMSDDQARAAHPEDYDAVSELTKDILENNPKYLQSVADSIARGENPAIKAYELIKADPEFPKLFPVAKTRIEARTAANKKPEELKPAKSQDEIVKEAAAKKAEEALLNNQNKTKTTGHIGSTDDRPADEMSLEEISKMSDIEFAKLPRKVRQKYLQLYG